jgi:hypothetical protein
MDKLETYLDRVCRGIAGPRSLRQHIRQELREHLKDAATEHAAAGMSEEEALAKAVEEFGGPEEVRAELEATHGQRFLTVVIDKAMLWKEKTMKARWLWSTWAHAALLLVIGMEVLFVGAVMVFILPKFREMVSDEFIRTGSDGNPAVNWGVSYLQGLAAVWEQGIWILAAVAIGWGIFEWYVRGENKTLIRLTKLGMIAVVMAGVSVLTSAALVLPLIIELGAAYSPQRVVLESEGGLVETLGQLKGAMGRQDWREIEALTGQAERLAKRWGRFQHRMPRSAEDVDRQTKEANLGSASLALSEAHRAALAQDRKKLDAEMERFSMFYANVRAGSATKPAGNVGGAADTGNIGNF